MEGISVSTNAQQVISKRYSLKTKDGNPCEDWSQITKRVVGFVSKAEKDIYTQAAFVNNMEPIMQERLFLPNTPCLVNAGKDNAQLAACFVLPIEDSIKGIMRTASDAAIIHQSGGGTGFTFERLRPAGSLVKTTNGVASGPVSFMEIFDKVTDVVKQGGVRRGANMGIMRVDHPDILRFIHAKQNQDKLLNFNISVAVTDEFMDAVKNKKYYQTKFNAEPWRGEIYDPVFNCDTNPPEEGMKGKLYAPLVWDRIIESAWKWGEPGVIFIDTVNRNNLLISSMGPITASNPCSEQFLHDYNSCNLGSIDVSKLYNPYNSLGINWEKFSEVIRWSVRFLDNVIDMCSWPIFEIKEIVWRTRPIGLGIMGFADLLLKMKVKYGSQESLEVLNKLMSFFQREAWKVSCLLGREKGRFPEYYMNDGVKEGYDRFLDNMFPHQTAQYYPRNYQVTTIAPTGTISLAADTSSGIEPNFAWTYKRVDTVGERDYVHPLAKSYLEKGEPLPDYFVTAHDLSAEQHVRVLATAQKYVDNGVSKTCNGHENDTVEDVRKLYELAYDLGVKSVSYYRDGSRVNQVLTATNTNLRNVSSSINGMKCSDCGQELVTFDGCSTCVSCGNSKCVL
jgi:ribonucleoside-diphosphate reductase alpha chain